LHFNSIEYFIYGNKDFCGCYYRRGELDRWEDGFSPFIYNFCYLKALERDCDVVFSLPSVLTLKLLTFDLALSLEAVC
jgi:hypothetical protein